ncbi:hypothetical protein K6V78_05030 [Streptococcus gallolyticus]|nr:hypothetical protein [Streptococcus gallolyticus]MBY5040997.1 hypothetical protein [Streptococcus gallolyticus]
MTYLPLLLMLVAITGVLFYRRKKDGRVEAFPKNEYDEYQQFLRGKGYQYAFYSLLAAIYVLYMLAELANIRFSQAFHFWFLMYVGLSVQIGYNIWTGTYFPINKSAGLIPRQFLLCNLCIFMVALYLIKIGDFPANAFAKGGLAMICLLGLFPLQNMLILCLRIWRDRREADE